MDTILGIDNAILDFIQNNICSPILDDFMVFVTKLGNGARIWILISLFLLLLKKYRKYGIMMILSLGISEVIGDDIIKHLVERARPCHINTSVELLINTPTSFSFPSGHTFKGFASATVLYFMNKKIGIGAYILAILIAFSRMYLYVHYPSDILGGGILGILVGIVVVKLYKKYINDKF